MGWKLQACDSRGKSETLKKTLFLGKHSSRIEETEVGRCLGR